MFRLVVARRLVFVAGVIILGAGLFAGAANAKPKHSTGAQPAVRYAVNRPLCATPKDPHTLRCFAMQRVNVAKGTAGAYAYRQQANLPWGPNGGYSPALLASAYGYNPDASTKGQLVAIIDWYNDPHVLGDLNHFDTRYGLTHETTTSFRTVNQKGKAAPLPKNDTGTSGEIALDVEAVRGVCHTCRILLIEADGPSIADTGVAVNTAVRMGATEISNSYGAPTAPKTAAILRAYNHPGVAITASTGDQGWYGWTDANQSHSPDSAYFPSTDPTVIGIGGTRLYVDTNDGTHYAEYVWNDEQVADAAGLDGIDEGATGGGCSTVYAAKLWQSQQANYTGLGCEGKRSAADVSAVGDPESGFDVYLTYGGFGWTTIGGTSLSSPVIAAMYALAGGAHGAAYPASTLYVNANRHPSSVYDVTNPGPQFDSADGFIAGGNSWCAGATISACESATNSEFNGTKNPNQVNTPDLLDCSFPRKSLPQGSRLNPQCNAIAGFDGPSGVGTPAGLGLFARTAPGLTVARPSSLRLHRSARFRARLTEVIAGAHGSSYAWNWGDGHTTTVSTASSSITASHTYAKPCACSVTLSVYDSLNQQVIKTTRIIVGEKASVRYKGPRKLRAHHAGSFSATGSSTPNTGARIAKYTWNFGDGHSAKDSSVTHTYRKPGNYTVTLKIADSTGVVTTAIHHVKVKH